MYSLNYSGTGNWRSNALQTRCGNTELWDKTPVNKDKNYLTHFCYPRKYLMSLPRWDMEQYDPPQQYQFSLSQIYAKNSIIIGKHCVSLALHLK